MMTPVENLRSKMFRLWDWWLYAALALWYVWVTSPMQLQVIGYKVSLVTIGLVLAYLADRAIYHRLADRIATGMPRDTFSAARLVARAIIVLAILHGMTNGA
jgi:hypothetical protein